MTDINAADWTEQDANNTNPSPNGVQGNYAPSTIGPIIRNIRGAIKREFVRTNPIFTTTGTGAAYLLTFVQAPSAYYKGQVFRFWSHINNTGACTINVNSLGAKSILSTHGVALTAGQIRANKVVELVYNGTSFELLSADVQDPKFTGNLTLTGTLSANAANISGALTANSASIAGPLTTGTIAANGSVTSRTTGGSIVLSPGNADRTGYIEFREADGTTRAAYIGFGDANTGVISMTAENGYTWNLGLGTRINGNIAWHSGNDGAGSTLDSDLLDGQHGAFYQNAANLNAGTLPNARLVGNYSFTDLTLDGKLVTNEIRTANGTEIVINAGDAAPYPTGQTGERLYVNAEGGLEVNSSTDNWATGWAGRDTTTITGSAITINGSTVWHAGNDGAGSTLDSDLLDGQHGSFYRDASNLNAGTVPNARLNGAYSGFTLSTTNVDITGSTWSTTVPASGLSISGAAPNIWFKSTTANTASALSGVSSNSWHVLTDGNGDGTYESLALTVPLTGAGANPLRYYGATVWTSANDGAGSGLDADTIRGIAAATLATKDLTVNAGNGLTGGGIIGTHPTVTLGTPGTITGSTTNAVTATSHTHTLTLVSADITGAIGFTPAPNTRSVIAGNGLTGGGTLAADRTLTLGTPGTISGSTTNAAIPGSHTHALTLVSADITDALAFTPPPNTRTITAGNGLTGGGSLGADRTLAIGTPGSITATSTNAVTATSHTHDLDMGSAPLRDPAADLDPRLLYINDVNNATFSRIGPVGLRAAFGVASSAISIVAGNGMTGGGTLEASRTVTMGTPGSITNASTNAVTTTSHTHALGFTAAEVYTGTDVNATTMAVGHSILARTSAGADRNSAATMRLDAGDTARYTSLGVGAALSGSYRARGLSSANDHMYQRTA